MQFAFITSFLHDISKSTNLDKINHDQLHNCLQDHYLLEFVYQTLHQPSIIYFLQKEDIFHPVNQNLEGCRLNNLTKKQKHILIDQIFVRWTIRKFIWFQQQNDPYLCQPHKLQVSQVICQTTKSDKMITPFSSACQ